MGYFDALSSVSFKTTQDGRNVFFPWGRFGRGYELRSQDEYRRLKDGLSVYYLVGIAAAILMPGLLLKGAVAVVAVTSYTAWALAWRRNRLPSTEKLTRTDCERNMATRMPTWILATLSVFCLLIILIATLELIVEPSSWPVALLTGGFSGVCGWTLTRLWRRKSEKGAKE